MTCFPVLRTTLHQLRSRNRILRTLTGLASAAPLKSGSFVRASVENNNNKFWNIRIDGPPYRVVVRYGRVGSAGAETSWAADSLAAAERLLERKVRDKTSSGYVEVRVLAAAGGSNHVAPRAVFADVLADIAARDMTSSGSGSGRDEGVKDLIRFLVGQNIHDILASTQLTYNAGAGSFSTPLGIVTRAAVDEARGVLGRINDIVCGRAARDGWEALVERYLTLVPSNVGRHRPTLDRLFPNEAAVQRYSSVLDALEESIATVQATAPAKDSTSGDAALPPRVFNACLREQHDASVTADVNQLFHGGRNPLHSRASSWNVSRVYDVTIDRMAADFADVGSRVGNVHRLWHGTRACNVLSILRMGMVVPASNASHVTGRLFGDGLYFSDQSTKSLNYSIGCAPGQRGSGSDSKSIFMFLCDVAMGRSYTPASYASGGFPVAGYDSTFAKGGVSGVMNNEMIVYKVEQVNPRMLVEFTPA